MRGRRALALAWLAPAAGLLALAATALLLGFLLREAAPAWGWELFFGRAPAWPAFWGRLPVWDGIWPACLGTLSLVALASLLAVPLGVAAGIHLAVYAGGRSRRLLSLAVDILASVPSIVMGLFGFALILLLRATLLPSANTCLLLAAACLALLILPYLVSATRLALLSLPPELGLQGAALGLSRWQNLRHVLLPAAGRGILGGVMLGVGRAAEDTAVIMLTGVVANAGLPAGLLGKFEALPFQIFYLASQYQGPEELRLGFGAALTLLALTGLLFLGASGLQRTLERRWRR
ncbi:MAG: ABC transporter permease subunit [Desulfarculus sp.]|nr:ABC transporter permease subunit [Desulfarculus sp.]